jgi:predicted dehydrogenase
MIKVSIIGAGRIAECYIKVLRDFKNIELVGIISRSKESSKQKSLKYKIHYHSNSLENMMKITKPDIVIVCVTPTETKKICLNLLKYKCIVLVEKPLGLSLKDSKEVLLKSKKSKSKIFIAFNRRFFNSTNLLINKLSKNASKRVVNIFDQEDTNAAKKNGHSKKIIDNWMYANSIHLIDFFTFLCRGKINNIVSQRIKINKNQYFIYSKIFFSSGDIGIYNAYWNRPAPWKISVSCSESYFQLSPIERLIEKNNRGEMITYKDSKYDIKYKPGFYLMVKNLLKVYTGKKNKLVSLKENCKTMKLINSIYK